MKLFDGAYHEDYGHEWYFQLLSFRHRFALIDGVVQWDTFPSTTIFPYLIIGIGCNELFGFSFRWKWFAIRVNLLTTKPKNLNYYNRENCYDEPIDSEV